MADQNNRAREPGGVIIDSGGGDGTSASGSETELGQSSGSAQNDGGNNDANASQSTSGTESGQRESINGIPVHDPGSDAGRWGFKPDGSPRGKPGRKPSGNSGSSSRSSKPSSGSSKQKNSVSVSGLEKLLFSVHMMAAVKLTIPELAIDNSEAKMLSEAIVAVQEHYGFDVSPEVALWMNLATALGVVYGPRVVTIYTRKKVKQNEEKKERPTPQQQKQQEVNKDFNIISIPGMHAPT